MSLKLKIITNFRKIRHFSSIKRNLTGGRVIFNKPSAASSAIPNVQGLTERVVKIPNEPVGPGATKDSNYPNPEYFSYDNTSYYEAEVEMLKYRCPQPSKFKYFEQNK